MTNLAQNILLPGDSHNRRMRGGKIIFVPPANPWTRDRERHLRDIRAARGAVEAARRRHGPRVPLCSTTFGGSTIPPIFGGGGGGGFGGYTFSSYSDLFFGNSNAVGNAARTLAVSASVGDLIVAFGLAGPGYGGQASLTLRTPTFAVWSSTGGILNFRGLPVNRFVQGIQPRIATGDSEDNCLIFSSGPFPVYLGCAVFSGDVWTGTLANITSDNEDSQILGANVNSMFRENGPPGGFTHTVKCFSSCKQTGAAQSGAGVGGTDQGIISLGLQNTGDNGFSQGSIIATGYKFEEFSVDTPTGSWPLDQTWTGDEFSLSSTFKSGAS